jgi:hypothetical protein
MRPLPWYKREVIHFVRNKNAAANEERHRVIGYFILLCSLSLCSLSLYLLIDAAVTTDWTRRSGDDDEGRGRGGGGAYYCYLLPALLPATIAFVIANWFSLKYFRHNN